MKKRRAMALILAASMVVSGAGQTAVFGAEFTAESVYEEVPEIAEGISVIEPEEATDAAEEAEIAEGFESEDLWTSDSEAQPEEFVSDEAEAALAFTDGEEENPDEGEPGEEEDNPYSSVVIAGELRDAEDRTTIFTNESQSYTVVTSALEGQDYKIEWQAGRYEPNGTDYDFVMDDSIPLEVSEDGSEVTLNGENLSAGNDFDLRAGIIVAGEEVCAANIGVQVWEPEYRYELLYLNEALQWLPRWWERVDRQFDYYMLDGEHYNGGNGERIQLGILSVTAENAFDDEGDGDAVSINPDDDGWVVWGERMGHAIVTVTYQTIEGEEASYTFDVYIGSENYGVNTELSTGTNNILPGKSVTLSAVPYVNCYDPEEDVHFDGDVSDVRIRWEYDEELKNFTITENENGTLTVTAAEEVDWEEADTEAKITAAAYIPGTEDEGDTDVASDETYIYVSGEYYTVTTDGYDGDVWGYGTQKTLTPVLKRFNENNEEGEVVTDEEILYYVETDWNCFAVTDAEGKELSEEDPNGTAPFTVTRIGIDGADMNLIAQFDKGIGDDPWFEVARDNIWVDGADFHIEPEELRENWYTWVYSDEDLFIPVNTDSLADHNSDMVKVEWKVGLWNEETDSFGTLLPEACYTIEKGGITLHGEALYANRGENEEDGYGFNLEANVFVMTTDEDGSEQWVDVDEVGFGADVRNPYDDWGDYDGQELRGLDYSHKNNLIWHYAENKDYPHGMEEAAVIKNIEVEDLRETSDEENPVIVVSNESGEWTVQPRNYGKARLTYTVESEKFGKLTFSVEKFVEQEFYQVNVGVEPHDVVLPGESVTLIPYVWHFVEGQDVQQVDESGFTTKYVYNEDVFSLTSGEDEVNGKFKAVAKDSANDYVVVEVTIPVEDGDPIVIEGGRVVYVEPEYGRIVVDGPVLTEPGAAVTVEDIKAELKHYDHSHPEGEIKDAEFSLGKYWTVENGECIEINEAGNGFTVKAPDLAVEDEPLTTYVKLVATGEAAEGEDAPVWETAVEITICNHKESAKVVEPTCTTEGSTVITCEKCNKVLENSTQPAIGHNYQEVVTRAATCTAEGVKTYTCQNCGDSYTKAIPMIAHNIVTVVDSEATCGTPGKQHKECSVCHGERTELPDIPATGNHSFGEYVVTKEATALAEGVETRTCSVCQATESRSIAKLKATIKVPATSIPLKLKQVFSFKVTGLAKGDYIKSAKSNKTKYVKVKYNKNGTIKLTAQKKAGTAKITVVTAAGAKKVITVKVQKTTVATKKITGLTKKLTIKKGKTSTLKPVLSPISSTDKITYTSSNKKVATVTSKGKIKAVKKGKAVITVKAGKVTYKCTVTVK